VKRLFLFLAAAACFATILKAMDPPFADYGPRGYQLLVP